jgi:hypothetical protein
MPLSAETIRAMSGGKPVVETGTSRYQGTNRIIGATALSVALCMFLTVNKDKASTNYIDQAAKASPQAAIPTVSINLEDKGTPSNTQLTEIAYQNGLIPTADFPIQNIYQNDKVIRIIFENDSVIIFDTSDIYLGTVSQNSTAIQIAHRFIVESN